MKLLSILCLFALVAFARAEDALSGPVTLTELQQLHDVLQVNAWVDASHSSPFHIDAQWKRMAWGGDYVRDWKSAETQTAALLARPDGPHSDMVKTFADFEARIDARQDQGFFDFMQDFDKAWKFEGR